MPVRCDPQVLELKVDVFWGRAYMAQENAFHVLFVRDHEARGGYAEPLAGSMVGGCASAFLRSMRGGRCSGDC